jgi:sialic acid synthase SpsE
MLISNKEIGKGRTFIIAEAGLNHNGDFDTALALIRKAGECGADAVKFQTFDTEKLIGPDVPVYKKSAGSPISQFERFQKLEFTSDQWRQLSQVSADEGLCFLSTPFDNKSVDMLDPMVEAYKVSSGDITNCILLRYIAKKGKKVIVSTGASDVNDIDRIFDFFDHGQVVLLHCVSLYPTPVDKVNLLSIKFLKDRYNCPVGYSDHTIGSDISLAAATMGADIIEKHFTLSKDQKGGDHALSADPDELKELISTIRKIETSIGNYSKDIIEEERAVRQLIRRGLVAGTQMSEGHLLKETDLMPLRPLKGIPVECADEYIGKKLVYNIEKGEILKETHFDN